MIRISGNCVLSAPVDREVFDGRLHLDHVRPRLSGDPRHLLGVRGERQRDALGSGRDGCEYRSCPSGGELARKRSIADQDADMIDPEAGQRESFLRGLDLVDLDQHYADPNSCRNDGTA